MKYAIPFAQSGLPPSDRLEKAYGLATAPMLLDLSRDPLSHILSLYVTAEGVRELSALPFPPDEAVMTAALLGGHPAIDQARWRVISAPTSRRRDRR